MKLLIVIVNYRTPGLTVDCLRSLAKVRDEADFRVDLVDNRSPDDSVQVLTRAITDEGWSGWVRFIEAPSNGGFAAGNNVSIRPALARDDCPPYILLLNPDTVVRRGAIAELLRFAESHPRCGIAGSRLEDHDGTVQRSAFRFHSPLGELEGRLRLGPVSRLLRRYQVAMPAPMQPARADWVAGASMLVRTELFREVGLLDEGFFMYYEEVEFCRRAARAGWQTWYVPASRVVHLVGAASGVSDGRVKRKRIPEYWFNSRRRYFQCATNSFTWALADLLWIIGFAGWRIRRRLSGAPDLDPPMYLQDFVRHSVFVRGFGP